MSLGSFSSALRHALVDEGTNDEANNFLDDSALRSLALRKSVATDISSYASLGLTTNGGQSTSPVNYVDFLNSVAGLTIDWAPVESISKTSDVPYGTGATMAVYPGTWSRKDGAKEWKQVVALKYCNMTAPQGASSLQDFSADLNSRIRALIAELQVLGSREGRYNKNFPHIHGLAWELFQSPTEVDIYQPIVIMEPAVSNLEDYVRSGKMNHGGRIQTEERFITSIHSAMNFLHASCGVVHGDLKPANVLIFQNTIKDCLEAKLADFGFAQNINPLVLGGKGDLGIVPGFTPYWSAPEYFMHKIMFDFQDLEYRFTRDYYSFGLLVWFILFGYPFGNLLRGPCEEDDVAFKRMKLQKDDLNERIAMAFESRWRWRKVDHKYIERLEKIDDAEKRGKEIVRLSKRSKIVEEEWNPEKSLWEPSTSKLHHVYRACMETTLRKEPRQRIAVVQKAKEEIFILSLADSLSSYYLTKDSSIYASVFNTTESEIRRLLTRYGVDNYGSSFFDSNSQIPVSVLAIATLPKPVASDMLQKIIDKANDESQNEATRLHHVQTILAFKERFPDMVDMNVWETRKATLGSATSRICFMISQIVTKYSVQEGQFPTEWILDGLSEFLLRSEDDPIKNEFDLGFRKAVEGIDPKVLELPLRSALWDYVADISIDESPRHSSRKKLPPIFQAVADGDIEAFETLAWEHRRLFSLKHGGYNLLHFATLHRRPSIMRTLMVDYNFDPIEPDDQGWSAMELCLKQETIDMILELSFLYSVVHKNWVRKQKESEKKKKPEEPIRDPSLQLFRPRALALLAGEGSFPVMEYVHKEYTNPRNLLSTLSLDIYAEKSPPSEDQHPLFIALRARRLRTFLRLLSWGREGKRTYPADSIVGGKTMLMHAIEELAPFLVAALLAYGADPNFKADTGFTPLQIVCRDDGSCYNNAIERRLKFHRSLELNEKILNKSATTPTDAGSMRKLIVELLLRFGARINEGVDVDQNADIQNLPVSKVGFGIGPLGWCIMTRKADLAIFLIEKGADVRLRSSLNPPISQAVHEGLKDVVECLLKHGISPDETFDIMPVFMSAVQQGRLDIFELFLDYGANLDFDISTTCVLHLLISEKGKSTEGFVRLREIVTERLASMPGYKLRSMVNRRCGGEMAIHVAALTVRGRYNYELLRLIIQNTGNPNAVDGSGRTAAQIAMMFGNVVFISALAEFGRG